MRSTAGGPIYNALIRIPALQLQRKTGPKGQSYIDRLKPGTHQLEIVAKGYVPRLEEVKIGVNASKVMEVVLEGES